MNGSIRCSSSLDVCLICGDRSSGIHFGVLTCEACKAFFRRSGVCSSSLIVGCCPIRCSITVETRNTCPSCRYEKCQRLGMDRNNVTFGKPRKEQRMNQEDEQLHRFLIDRFERLKSILGGISSFLNEEHFQSFTQLINELFGAVLFVDEQKNLQLFERILHLTFHSMIDSLIRRYSSVDPLKIRLLFFLCLFVSSARGLAEKCFQPSLMVNTTIQLLQLQSSLIDDAMFSVDFVNTLTILTDLLPTVE